MCIKDIIPSPMAQDRAVNPMRYDITAYLHSLYDASSADRDAGRVCKRSRAADHTWRLRGYPTILSFLPRDGVLLVTFQAHLLHQIHIGVFGDNRIALLLDSGAICSPVVREAQRIFKALEK
jgi:hypothetical protein